MRIRSGAGALAIAVAAACATGSDESGSSYGYVTYAPTTAPPGGSGAEDGSGGSASDTGEDGGSTSANGDSTGAASGPDSASSDAGSSADQGGSGGGDNGMQPADGMYSDCLLAAECVGLNTCITILDQMDMPIDGFCSNNGCTDPPTQCDASPGGTAVPFCMNVTLNGSPDTACALDCGGGATCPGGMMCWELGSVSICV